MLEINKIRVYKVTKYKVTFLTVSQVQRFSMFPTSPEYMVLLFVIPHVSHVNTNYDKS